jgi:hypothetical protein
MLVGPFNELSGLRERLAGAGKECIRRGGSGGGVPSEESEPWVREENPASPSVADKLASSPKADSSLVGFDAEGSLSRASAIPRT